MWAQWIKVRNMFKNEIWNYCSALQRLYETNGNTDNSPPEVGSKPTCAITIVRPFPDGKEKTTLVSKSILLDYYYTFTWLNLYIFSSLS